jgi:hypothetical protein
MSDELSQSNKIQKLPEQLSWSYHFQITRANSYLEISSYCKARNGRLLHDFLELSEKIMREEQRPLSQKEIWDIAKEKGYNKSVVTKGKTPWATIGSKLYVDIRDNPAKTKFIKLKEKPTRFFLKELHYDSNPVIYSPTSEGKHPGINFKERDLHKYLSYFVYNYGFIYTKNDLP